MTDGDETDEGEVSVASEGLDEQLREQLEWLIDVPLFVDEHRIGRLYDIVVGSIFRPYRREPEAGGETEEEREFASGGGSFEGNTDLSLETSELVEMIAGGLPISGGLSLTGMLDGSFERESFDRSSRQFQLVQGPQRQLAQIVLRYLGVVADSDSDGDGGERIQIADSGEFGGEPIVCEGFGEVSDHLGGNCTPTPPRDLLVLELPGVRDSGATTAGGSQESDLATTLVPTAAEFADGAVVSLYRDLRSGRELPPRYPQRDLTWSQLGEYYNSEEDTYDPGARVGDDVLEAREYYWDWFEDSFDPKTVVRTIEEAAGEHGRIEWIDFRLPYTDEGNTLHLHIQGRGAYNTGTFAYNLVKRGYEHGIRLVGTAKSGPDLDVLAIYER
ncbi:hypothetical protein [Halobaculum sp. MBLA0143]|uniref:hypothetical protein n=1 Tax=Halobaculum sp. MBLA0143 TaxID=3079933 RepID=UPI0035250EED